MKYLLFFLSFLTLYEGDGGGGGGGGGGDGGDGGDGGSGGGNWRDALPEDIRDSTHLSKFEDVGALAKSYIDADVAISKGIQRVPDANTSPEERKAFYERLGGVPDVLVRPGADADDEARGKFYEALGRPHEAKGYEFAVPDGVLPEGYEYDPNMVESFRDVFFDAGISQEAAQKIHDAHLRWQVQQMQAYEKSKDEARDALKREWGDKYDARLGVAKTVVKELGSEKLAQELEITGLGNNPELLRLLDKVGQNMLEDDVLKGIGGRSAGDSASELKEQIQALREDPAYFDGAHQRHKAVVEKVNSLEETLSKLERQPAGAEA